MTLEQLDNEIARLTALRATLLPRDFASRFDAAFRKLDERSGGHNFVSLVDLRRTVHAWPLAVFDAELRKLRVDRVYTLSAAEGRYGVTPEERDAAIHEDGSMLLYVSRRKS